MIKALRPPIAHERLLETLSYTPKTGKFHHLKGVRSGREAGSINPKTGYRNISLYSQTYRAHRLAWFYMKAIWPSGQVDHKDTNRLNNVWENLREATHGQNKQNSGVRKNNKCGLKGVYKTRGRYECRIMADGKRHYIGKFKTALEAYEAYAAAAETFHGEFARVA